MGGEFDYWRLLAGLSLFLFAMSQMEAGLSGLGGRSLAKFLQEQTGHRYKSVAGGILGTLFLQSSSVVGLMVLAFVGAGLLSLTNALGIIFGSNLGTTLTGWIVTSLGFKLDIEALALPLVAVGGGLLLFAKGRWSEFGRVLIGLGLLLLGLQFMKQGVAEFAEAAGAADLGGYSIIEYLLMGAVFAAIVQSSSATMMINLSALYAGVISLPEAAGIAIGADLGTTTTMMIGALKGAPAKKRVAAAHVLFNLVSAVLAYVFLDQLLDLIRLMGITDPLYSLVAFHSIFNLFTLLLFYPFIPQLAAKLETWFVTDDDRQSIYIRDVDANISAAALPAIAKETGALIARVLEQNRYVFMNPLRVPQGIAPVSAPAPEVDGSFDHRYELTKQHEGEIVAFALQAQAQPLEEAESQHLDQLLLAVRQAMVSAKQLKDVHHNIEDLTEAYSDSLHSYLGGFRDMLAGFYTDIYHLRSADDRAVSVEALLDAWRSLLAANEKVHLKIYDDIRGQRVSESSIASLFNVNREVFSSCHALLMALANYQLNAEEAQMLLRLPEPVLT